jgi:hypothetical protein
MLKQKGSALRWLAYFFALQALVLFAASCSGSSSNDGQGLDKTATTANSVPPMPRAFDCGDQPLICGIAEGATEAIANRDAPWFSAKAVPRKVTCPDLVVQTCNQVPAGVIALSIAMASWGEPVWGFFPIAAAVVVAWAIGEYITDRVWQGRSR